MKIPMHSKKLFFAIITLLLLSFPHILAFGKDLVLNGQILSGRIPVSGAQILFYDENGVLMGQTISNPDGSFTFSLAPVEIRFTTSPSSRIKASISRTGPSSWRIDLNQPRSVFSSLSSFLRQHSPITGPIGGGLVGAFLTSLVTFLRRKIDNYRKRCNFRDVYLKPIEIKLRDTFFGIKEQVIKNNIGHSVPQYAKDIKKLTSEIQRLIAKYEYPLFEYDRVALTRLHNYFNNFEDLSGFFRDSDLDHQVLLNSCFQNPDSAKNHSPELLECVKSMESLLNSPLTCSKNK